MIILLVCAAFIGLLVLLLTYYPPFGKKVSKEKRNQFRHLPNFKKNRFVNQIHTSMSFERADLVSLIQDYIRGNPNRTPSFPLPIVRVELKSRQQTNETRVTWFGHSAFMLEIEGKTLLFDPMLGTEPSPFPIFGNKRFSKNIPIDFDKLPIIDAVIFSHDHYDHLDFGSIHKIKEKVKHFYVPLGVGGHLERWGIPKPHITEHDWWQVSKLDGIQLICMPARHFSGRSLFDKDSTLWSSWAIISRKSRVYYSGDSGYGPHFQEIGEKYGPFDLTLMECGQYDKRWANIHMMPEETVQAHLDVRGQMLLPVHWGAFTLSLHDWNDPIERVTKAAEEAQVKIVTPIIGESVKISSTETLEYDKVAWWRL